MTENNDCISEAYVYMLMCEGNRIYTGYSTDALTRWQAHQKGSARFTKAFKPISLLGIWSVEDGKKAALRLEWHIKKKCSRAQKDLFVADPTTLVVWAQEKLEVSCKPFAFVAP